jgi:ABC-type transport system substrate-binding protein
MSKRFGKIGWIVLTVALVAGLGILPACGGGGGGGSTNPYIGSGLLDGSGIPTDFFTDRATRVGFSYAFDYDTYIHEALQDQGKCVGSPIVEGLYGYCATSPKYFFCLTLAKYYLEHSGWGNLSSIGFSFNLAYNAGNLVRKTACDLLAEGVNSISDAMMISVLPMAWPTYLDRMEAGILPMWQIGWLPDYPHADDYVVPFMATAGDFAYLQSYGNATIDAKITAAFNELDPDQQLADYAELAEIYHYDAPGIMGAQPLARRYFTGHISGFFYNPCETAYFGHLLGLTKSNNGSCTIPYLHDGYFNYQTIGDLRTLDPAWAYDTASSEKIEQIYETLLYYNGSSTLDFVPILATDTGTFNSTNNTLRFTIRAGVNFSNGDPMTVADVEYSIKRCMVIRRASGPSWMLYMPLLNSWGFDCRFPGNFTLVDNAVEVDGNDIVFHLAGAGWAVPFRQILTQSWAAIVDKDYCINTLGDWNGTQADVARVYRPATADLTALYDVAMGTGPFTLNTWNKGVSIALDKNPTYWNEGSTPVPFDHFVTTVVESWPSRKAALLAGDADLVDVPATNYNEMDPYLNLSKFNYYFNLPSLTIDAFFFNFNIIEP